MASACPHTRRHRSRLVRRQGRHAAVAGCPDPMPRPEAHVGMQQVGAILRQNAHRVDARVGAVGERKVDNAELATKANRRLSDLLGERPQSAALSSCEGASRCILSYSSISPSVIDVSNPLALGTAPGRAQPNNAPCGKGSSRAFKRARSRRGTREWCGRSRTSPRRRC